MELNSLFKKCKAALFRHNVNYSSPEQARKSWSTSLTDPTPEEVAVKTLKCRKQAAEVVQRGR